MFSVRRVSIMIVMLVVLCFSCVHFIEAGKYRPELSVRHLEQYTLTLTVYCLENDDFQRAVQFHFGPGRELLGFMVADPWNNYINIYMPKTPGGKVDVAVLGHEFGHALDFVNKMKNLGYTMFDPDHELGMSRLILPEDTILNFRYYEHRASEKYGDGTIRR
jgi:hypothetical protein